MTLDMFLHCLGAAAMQAGAALVFGLAGWAIGYPLWAAFAGAVLAAGPVVWWWRRREYRQAETKTSHSVNHAEWICTIPAVIIFAGALGAAAWSV